MNLRIANSAHSAAETYRAVCAPGHEDSIAHLAELADYIEQRAREGAPEVELFDLASTLAALDGVVCIGLANDRIARAAGFADSEGGHCD